MRSAVRRETGLMGLAAAFVLLAVVATLIGPSARAGAWLPPDPTLLLAAVGWLACAGLALAVVQRCLPQHDRYLLPVVYLLAGWSLAVIWRLAPAFAARQAVWLGVGTLAMLGIVLLPGDLRWLRRYRYTWLSLGLALTALTLVLGVNPSGAGQRLWLGCCGLYLQPAEVLKLLLVAFVASYLADRREVVFAGGNGRAPLPASRPALAYFSPLLLMWGFSTLLLFTQRDLGMSTLLFTVFVAMLYVASGRAFYLAAGAALLGVAAALGYLLFDVVRLRIEAWWAPWADPSGRSFQIVQSLIAFAAGGLFGRGPGLGSPGLVPVAHSDFILAAVAEEWGLAGLLGLFGLLAVVVQRGLRIAAETAGAFGQLLAAGLAATLGLQTLLIAGGVSKLVPLTGVTLPFVSYGGSSLLANFILLGLLLRLSAARQPVARGTGSASDKPGV